MKKLSIILIIALLAAISCQAQTKTFVDLPSYAQASLLEQRGTEYHTAGDIITIGGAAIALSSLQNSGTKTDRATRIVAGVAVIALGRILHLAGTYENTRAKRIRFTSNGISFNF